MSTTTTLWPFFIPTTLSVAPILVALAAGAIALGTDTAEGACTAPSTAELAFVSGAGSAARVKRTVAPDGSEVLHGETELSLGEKTRRCIVEDVSLDAQGRLARADVAVAAWCGAEPESRAHLDPERGRATWSTRSATSEVTATSSLPWIYTPELLPGIPATTPIAAWVASRAAALSPSLALLQLERRRAWRVPRDQVVVATERGATVVLGNDGADVSAGFVERVHLGDCGVTLVRVPRADEPLI